MAALAGAIALTGASNAEAYAVKRTSGGDLVHWEEGTVGYTIDPSVDRNVAHASGATSDAMASWSGTVGAPALQPVALDARSPKSPGFDQKNGVFYIREGYAPAGRALAITVLTYDNASGRILDADVIFNGVYTFEVLGAPDSLNVANGPTTHPSTTTDGITHAGRTVTEETHEIVYDLHHVIAHELGHSLGMNDELGREDALMYRYSAPNDATIREPGSDDIAGLAELYSTRYEGRGNGCASATVAPKKPSRSASHAAMFATLGLLLFLVLRARNDKRARVGFVLAAAAATIAFVPNLSGKQAVAHASETQLALGHARAKVLGVSTAIESGLFKTNFQLATTACRAASCPRNGHGSVWGGTIGNVTQEVGGYYAPNAGDEVDISFAKLPSALSPLSNPLTGRDGAEVDLSAEVTVLTRAD